MSGTDIHRTHARSVGMRLATVLCGMLFAAASQHAPAQSHAGHEGHQAHTGHAQEAEPMPDASPPPDADASAPPRTPIPEPTAEDLEVAFPELKPHTGHAERIVWKLNLDRLEAWDTDGAAWELQGWLGTDLNRVWLRSKGERAHGATESAEVELLYGRSIGPWWDVLAGLRHDSLPGPARDRLAVGVQGLAPYKFEIAATAWIGHNGATSLRAEAEYDLLLTNRLILQPAVEIEAHDRRDLARDTGAGLTTLEAGLRLRYEISRRFAPYLGLEHVRSFGATRQIRRDEGESASDTRIVGGVRIWF